MSKQTAPKRSRVSKKQHQSRSLDKKLRPAKKQLSSSLHLLRKNCRHVWQHKRLFIGIMAVYALLSIVFVSGLANISELTDMKQSIEESLAGVGGQLTLGLATFGYLLGNQSTAVDEVASAYQSMLFVIMSLVVIWSLRQTYADRKVTVKDAFYRSMYPLVPFLGVLIVICLQLIPVAIASWLFSSTVVAGLAVTSTEQILWSVVSLLLTLWSVYMVSSSIFALFIVTLPNMTPIKALRSARDLVRYRRAGILRKLLFLPIFLLFIGAVLLVPIILWLTPLTVIAYLAYSMAVFLVCFSYVYALYRELL